MKQCGLVLASFLKKFSKNEQLYSDLSILLTYYWQYVTEVRLQSNRILYVGISFLQCLPYLSMYKSSFIKELIKKNYSIADMVFYFQSQSQSKKKIEEMSINKKNIVKKNQNQVELSLSEKISIKNKFQKLALDKQYCSLFYKLYLIAKNNDNYKT